MKNYLPRARIVNLQGEKVKVLSPAPRGRSGNYVDAIIPSLDIDINYIGK